MELAARHLRESINAVPDPSRIELGRLVLDEVAIDLPRITANVVSMWSQAATLRADWPATAVVRSDLSSTTQARHVRELIRSSEADTRCASDSLGGIFSDRA